MKKNIGTADRIFRAIVFIVLFGLAWWWHSWIIAVFGLFAAYEALASWCVLYQLLGKNSCPIK